MEEKSNPYRAPNAALTRKRDGHTDRWVQYKVFKVWLYFATVAIVGIAIYAVSVILR